MGNKKSDHKAKPLSKWWHFSLFEWIDKQPSESKRRILQNIVSYTIWAAVAATFSFIVIKRYWIIDGTKSIWNFLQTPILLKIWSALLAFVSVVWNLHMLRTKKSERLFIAEIEKLKTQISEQIAQDPRFIAVIKFIIDDNRAKGFKYLVEYGIGAIDKAVPLVLKSEIFDEFLANAGLTLHIDDSVKVGLDFNSCGQMSFGVPSMENPFKYDMAVFIIEKNKVVRMNTAAHLHFDWAYLTFKKQFDIDFETHKEKTTKQKVIAKAAIAIHKKYIPIMNSWENCTVLMEESADIKLKERQANFLTLVEQFWTEFEEKKLLIPADLAMDFQVIVNKAIDYVRRCDRATIYENSKPKNVALMDSHYLPIDALQREIPTLRSELEKKIRRAIGVE